MLSSEELNFIPSETSLVRLGTGQDISEGMAVSPSAAIGQQQGQGPAR